MLKNDKMFIFFTKSIDKYFYSKYNVIELIEHSSHKLITAGSASFFSPISLFAELAVIFLLLSVSVKTIEDRGQFSAFG